MMVSSPEEATEAHPITVKDHIGSLSIVGWKIAELTWTYAEARAQGHNRWTDITLYRVANDPNMKYAVQILGRSAVYHAVGGPCTSGVSVPVGAFAEDHDRYQHLQPCPRCNPKDLSLLDDKETVKIEVDLARLYKCRNADDVVRSMYSHGTREGRKPSGLSIKILTAAASVDPAIDQALMTVPRP